MTSTVIEFFRSHQITKDTSRNKIENKIKKFEELKCNRKQNMLKCADGFPRKCLVLMSAVTKISRKNKKYNIKIEMDLKVILLSIK